MYAIIEEGGRQFKVSSGDTIDIDRDVAPEQTSITFDRVLLVGGEQATVGAPVVAGATVTADVVGPVKGPKVEIYKYKNRKGYHKHIGHRQPYLRVKITGINV